MKIFDLSCEECGTHYKVAESDTHPGDAGELECEVCGKVVARWKEPKLRVARLLASPESATLLVTTAPPPLI